MEESPQRLEVALVRELEIAFQAGTVPAATGHGSPYQWANACHDLFEAGRIDILEYSARRLHTIFPDLSYLTSLVELFDAVPHHVPGLLDFSDDRTAEVQIVRRPDCEAVLVCFCARNGTLGLPLNFIHLWLGRLPASLIYLKDFRDLYGALGYQTLGGDRVSSIEALRGMVRDIGGRRLYGLGVSLGGFPALYYSYLLRAEAVLNIAGPTDLTQPFTKRLGPISPSYLRLLDEAPEYARNLRNMYAATERRPRVLLAYGDGHLRDRQQAERMAGLPNVELIPMSNYAPHNVLHPCIREGQFLKLLFRLLSQTPPAGPEQAA